MKDCPNKAEYRYAWGDKIMHGCHQHANAMKALSDAIGSSFNAEPDVDGMREGKMCEHKDDLGEETDENAAND